MEVGVTGMLMVDTVTHAHTCVGMKLCPFKSYKSVLYMHITYYVHTHRETIFFLVRFKEKGWFVDIAKTLRGKLPASFLGTISQKCPGQIFFSFSNEFRGAPWSHVKYNLKRLLNEYKYRSYSYKSFTGRGQRQAWERDSLLLAERSLSPTQLRTGDCLFRSRSLLTLSTDQIRLLHTQTKLGSREDWTSVELDIQASGEMSTFWRAL